MMKQVLVAIACALPLVWGATGASAFTTSGATGAGGGADFTDPDQKVSAFGGPDAADPVAWSLLAMKNSVNPPRPTVQPRDSMSPKEVVPGTGAQ